MANFNKKTDITNARHQENMCVSSTRVRSHDYRGRKQKTSHYHLNIEYKQDTTARDC